jgi:hypothetical protein
MKKAITHHNVLDFISEGYTCGHALTENKNSDHVWLVLMCEVIK